MHIGGDDDVDDDQNGETPLTGTLSMDCIAGSSIAQHLSVFHDMKSEKQLPLKILYVDARSEQERLIDEKSIIKVPVAVYNRPVPGSPQLRQHSPKTSPRSHDISKQHHHRKSPSKDWYEDDPPPSVMTTTTTPSKPPKPEPIIYERFIIHRLKNCVWMDIEEDEIGQDQWSVFIKKFEFYRAEYLICILGGSNGKYASILTEELLRREMPYVTCGIRKWKKGSHSLSQFACLVDALTSTCTAQTIERLMIVSEAPKVASPGPIKPSAPLGDTGPSFLSIAANRMTNSSNQWGGIIRKKINSKTSSRRISSPVVLAPHPPTVVPPATTRNGTTEFEIGEEEDEIADDNSSRRSDSLASVKF